MSDDWLNTDVEDEAAMAVETASSAKVKFDPSDGSAYKKGDVGDIEDGASLWLVTFTDAMALMLTFFVMLYSMSAPSEEKWEKMTEGIYRHFDKYKSPEWHSGPQESIDISKVDYSEALNLNYLATVVTDNLSRNSDLGNILVFPQGQSLVVSLPQDLLFEAGRTEISSKGKQALFTVGGALSNIRNRIEVIGHADPRPVEGGSAYASNWELSLRRAMGVAGVLKNVGYERPIITRGLSSSRYDELPSEWPEEQRQSLSRRVDILIMRDDGQEIRF